MTATTRPHRRGRPSLRDAQAVAELFVGFFRRDLLGFYPQSRFEPVDAAAPAATTSGRARTSGSSRTTTGRPPGRAVRRPLRRRPARRAAGSRRTTGG